MATNVDHGTIPKDKECGIWDGIGTSKKQGKYHIFYVFAGDFYTYVFPHAYIYISGQIIIFHRSSSLWGDSLTKNMFWGDILWLLQFSDMYVYIYNHIYITLYIYIYIYMYIFVFQYLAKLRFLAKSYALNKSYEHPHRTERGYGPKGLPNFCEGCIMYM